MPYEHMRYRTQERDVSPRVKSLIDQFWRWREGKPTPKMIAIAVFVTIRGHIRLACSWLRAKLWLLKRPQPFERWEWKSDRTKALLEYAKKYPLLKVQAIDEINRLERYGESYDEMERYWRDRGVER